MVKYLIILLLIVSCDVEIKHNDRCDYYSGKMEGLAFAINNTTDGRTSGIYIFELTKTMEEAVSTGQCGIRVEEVDEMIKPNEEIEVTQ